MRSLLRLTAKNFLSLQEVEVTLQDLNVLVGPNGAGKTNFLRVIQFLGDTARMDLGPAIRHNVNAKEAFRRALRRSSGKPPRDYAESDAPKIAVLCSNRTKLSLA